MGCTGLVTMKEVAKYNMTQRNPDVCNYYKGLNVIYLAYTWAWGFSIIPKIPHLCMQIL